MIEWIQFLSTFWMVCVIWFVQIVHYPLFLKINESTSRDYFKQHQFLISWIVLPAMILEAVSLLLLRAHNFNSIFWSLSFLLLILIWCSTFLVQVPIHRQLLNEPSQSLIKKLIYTNWIRTILWTLKMGVVVTLLKGSL